MRGGRSGQPLVASHMAERGVQLQLVTHSSPVRLCHYDVLGPSEPAIVPMKGGCTVRLC